MPLNINVISATDEEDEHHHIDHEIADTLNITGHTCLSTNEVRELITAIESGTAYNADVYNNLRKQLAEVDDKPTA